MAKVSREADRVKARILYWGAEGAGKRSNLRAAHAKLRPDHRGEIRQVPTRLDPTVHYEVLPISLGEVAGVRTQLELVAVPSQPEQAPTRKQLLDEVDGIVLVVDSQGGRVDANTASYEELRQSLAAYGRRLQDVPVVVQYNKRDLGDPYALEDLHRKLETGGAPVFEAVATEGTGVLQTLSTVSKRVIRALREQGLAAAPAGASPAGAPPPEAGAPPPDAAGRMEQAILDEPQHPEVEQAALQAETLLERPALGEDPDARRGLRLGPDLSIVSVGEASRADERSLRVPVVLGDGEGGTATLLLTIRLDPLLDDG